jgi:hypothetical protein
MGALESVHPPKKNKLIRIALPASPEFWGNKLQVFPNPDA